MSESVRSSHAPTTLRRLRWFILYALLVIVSHVVSSMRERPMPPEHSAHVDPNRRTIEVPALDDRGPVAGSTMRLSFIDTPAEDEAARRTVSKGTEAKPPDSAAETPDEKLPIILVHGSPGSAADFGKLAPALAQRGHRVIAVDLPGFGDSSRAAPSYSILAHARAVLTLMDELHIPRSHVVGWSMGGGVVLHLDQLAPQRLASMTLLAAIGSQENEGSRSYFFEHMKYRAGMAIFMGIPELVPHFGLLPDPRTTVSHSWLRNFSDTDMRPLRGIMERSRTPALVLHGRRDFLVPDWAAEDHARRIPGASLVMIDALHFLPFMQVEETADHLVEFAESHENSGGDRGAGRHGGAAVVARVSEVPGRAHATGIVGGNLAALLRMTPWWIIVAGLALLALRRPHFAVAVGTALAAQIRIDPAVGGAGVLFGRWLIGLTPLVLPRSERVLTLMFGATPLVSEVDWTRRFARSRPGFWFGVRSVLRPDWRVTGPRAVGLLLPDRLSVVLVCLGITAGALAITFVQYIPALVLSMLANTVFRHDYPVESVGGWLLRLSLFVASFGAIYLLIATIPLLLTWTGRRMLLATIRRSFYTEFWPTKLFYTPLAPYYAWLVARTRRWVPYTACNPALSGHGGVIAESKYQIQSSLDATSGHVLPCVLIPAGGHAASRAALARAAVSQHAELNGYPIIVKPDSGFRGFSVRLIRHPEEFDAYFAMMHDAAIVQRYHPGPHEIGVMWIRRMPGDVNAPGRASGADTAASTGFIFSITRKEFPFVRGDGRRTLEQLIYRDARLRCQACVFLTRFADDASRVLDAGEIIRLAQSGNHCQGTLFRDGADLITPELTAAVDRLASTFHGAQANGLDIGRFDLRFESEEDLRSGRNFGVVELNGTTGESTNVYDPFKSFVWRYRVLFALWRHLFELGVWRVSLGTPSMTARTLLGSLRSFFRRRTGSELAD